jgi:hypothetical protein
MPKETITIISQLDTSHSRRFYLAHFYIQYPGGAATGLKGRIPRIITERKQRNGKQVNLKGRSL